MQRVFLI